MNYTEIVDDVRAEVKGENAEALSKIPGFVNDALDFIAEDVLIPSLKTLGTVTTVLSRAYTTMPVTSAKKLLFAGTSEGRVTILDGGLLELLESFPNLDEEGSVEYVALHEDTLYYQGIPTEETTITLLFYRKPTHLVNGTDEPSFLPSALHRGLVVSKAAELAYDGIEAKMEVKPNTERCRGAYEDAKNTFLEWIARRRGSKSRSVWDV